MNEENWKKFVKSSKNAYMKIGHVQCPAFGNEKIYFTNKGFNHLLKKERKFRSRDEQRRRLGLFPYVKNILEKNTEFTTYRVTTKQFEVMGKVIISTARFWSFTKVIGTKIIFAVVCQINNEPKHFISVMDDEVEV